MRDTWTLPAAELSDSELREEIERIDILWGAHLDQIRSGNDNVHRARSMRENNKRRKLLVKEQSRRGAL